MSATQSPARTTPRPFENPRYGRNARTAIAQAFMTMFPLEDVDEELLVSRRTDAEIHDLFEVVKGNLRIIEQVSLAALNRKEMPKAKKIEEEAKIKAPFASFMDSMKAAHRADWQARQDRRNSEKAPPAAERAAG